MTDFEGTEEILEGPRLDAGETDVDSWSAGPVPMASTHVSYSSSGTYPSFQAVQA